MYTKQIKSIHSSILFEIISNQNLQNQKASITQNSNRFRIPKQFKIFKLGFKIGF